MGRITSHIWRLENKKCSKPPTKWSCIIHTPKKKRLVTYQYGRKCRESSDENSWRLCFPDVLVVFCSSDSDHFRSIAMPAPIYPSALSHSNSHLFWWYQSCGDLSIQRLLLLRSNDHSKSQEVWIHCCCIYNTYLTYLQPPQVASSFTLEGQFHHEKGISKTCGECPRQGCHSHFVLHWKIHQHSRSVPSFFERQNMTSLSRLLRITSRRLPFQIFPTVHLSYDKNRCKGSLVIQRRPSSWNMQTSCGLISRHRHYGTNPCSSMLYPLVICYSLLLSQCP